MTTSFRLLNNLIKLYQTEVSIGPLYKSHVLLGRFGPIVMMTIGHACQNINLDAFSQDISTLNLPSKGSDN